MKSISGVCFSLALSVCINIASVGAQFEEIRKILSKCHRNDKSFDNCMKDALNEIRPYFKDGISDLGVASFDPHFATQVDQKRGGYNANYNLKLTDVFERGWTISKVTKFKTDWKNNRIIYSQFFPEKSLSGSYDLTAFALGSSMSRSGIWNMTLYDYTQTTTITRKPVVVNGRKEYNGQPVDVKVEIDKIDNMQIHVSNILNGNNILERILDMIINATWRPGFAVIRPLINDLVSTAFTKIWSDSFRNFPFEKIFPE